MSTDQDKIKDIETRMHEVYRLIAELDSQHAETSDYPCIYDVGARTTGPGGAGGLYIAQCKKWAIEGTQPPLCYAHARKTLLDLLVEGQAKISAIKKEPLRRNVPGTNIYDPNNILITGAEYDEYKGAKGTCTANVKEMSGGVYGRKDAICRALYRKT